MEETGGFRHTEKWKKYVQRSRINHGIGFRILILPPAPRQPQFPKPRGRRSSTLHQLSGCVTFWHTLSMITSNSLSRTSRLVARISPEDKALLERAAGLEGTSVAAFIMGHGRTAAREIVRQYETVRLNQTESQRFVEALLAPSKAPAKRLKDAIALHRTTVTER